VRNYSEDTARKIDEAVKELIGEQYRRVMELLRDRRAELERVAEALLERETLTAEQFVRVLQGEELEDEEEADANATRIIPKARVKGEPGLGGA